MRILRGILVLIILGGWMAPAVAQEEEPWPVRLREPRVAPLPESQWGEIERSILLPDAQPALRQNVFTTLVRHAPLVSAWGPFGRYVLQQSELPAREREIVILRMGWLCQSGYEWGQHARIGLLSGLTAEDLHKIAVGPEAEGWTDFERTLLRAADELHYHSVLSDETWQSLRDNYSLEQTLDVVLTAGEYKLVSMALNSLGVQLDPDVRTLLPTDVKRPEPAGMPELPLPEQARVEPLPREEWSEGQRTLLEPLAEGETVNHGYATFVRHPTAFAVAVPFLWYLQMESTLPEPVRHKVLLRVYWRTGCDYEWAHQSRRALEGGLTDEDLEMLRKPWAGEDYPLIRAVDQLVLDAFIDDETWETLEETLNTGQLIDLIFTAGGANITAMTINSLGVQREPEVETP